MLQKRQTIPVIPSILQITANTSQNLTKVVTTDLGGTSSEIQATDVSPDDPTVNLPVDIARINTRKGEALSNQFQSIDVIYDDNGTEVTESYPLNNVINGNTISCFRNFDNSKLILEANMDNIIGAETFDDFTVDAEDSSGYFSISDLTSELKYEITLTDLNGDFWVYDDLEQDPTAFITLTHNGVEYYVESSENDSTTMYAVIQINSTYYQVEYTIPEEFVLANGTMPDGVAKYVDAFTLYVDGVITNETTFPKE